MNILEITSQTWITLGIVAGVFAGSAILIGALILFVGKVFKVNVDEKVTKILENLAGANCGGCGCSGCGGFAAKLADGSGNLADCHVTSPEKKAEIAKLLGIDLKDEEPTVATVHCNGTAENCAVKFKYLGNPTCAGCNSLLGGNKSCKFACLGCGDCAAACNEGAIEIVNGVAKIDPDKCVSCGACIKACPKKLISRIPLSAPVVVGCSSLLKGKEVMTACKTGCIGCGICAKNCPNGAIAMVDNLPSIDYEKCTGCMTCVQKCPKKIILSRKISDGRVEEIKIKPAQPAEKTA